MTNDDRKTIKNALAQSIAKLPTAVNFEQSSELLFSMGEVLEGDPADIDADTVEVISRTMVETMGVLNRAMQEESIPSAQANEAALAAYRLASSLAIRGTNDEPVPIILKNDTEVPDITKDRQKMCGSLSQMMTVVNSVTNVIAHTAISGEEDRHATSRNVQMFTRRTDTSNKVDRTMGSGDTVSLPSLNALNVDGQKQQELEFKMVRFPFNPYPCSYPAEVINTHTVSIIAVKTTEKIKKRLTLGEDEEEKVSIYVKRRGVPRGFSSNITTRGFPYIGRENFRIHRVELPLSNVAVHIVIERDDPNITMLVTWTQGYRPQRVDFEMTEYVLTKKHGPWYMISILARENKTPVNGTYYVGLLPYSNKISRYIKRRDYYKVQLKDRKYGYCYTRYNLTVFVSRCFFHENDTWNDKGCEVGPKTNFTYVHCLCNHMSVFSASFLVAPNKIDFSNLPQLFASARENMVVIAFVIICWILYLIALVWAILRDRDHRNKKGLLYIESNDPSESYGYVIAIYTGIRWNAGTTSNVSIKLHGRRGVSEEKRLSTTKRKVLETGGQDWFFFKTGSYLGDVEGISITVTFSGDHPDWYLSQIRVKDLQSGKFYIFLANDWYLANVDDWKVEDFLAPLTPHEMRKFFLVIQRRAVNDLRERHLWFSVFSFPPQSNFTRAQRLTSAFSLFLVAMLVNIMFFGIVPEHKKSREHIHDEADTSASVDLFFAKFEITPLIIGIESSLIAFPFGLFILELFSNIHYPELSEEEQIKLLEIEEDDLIERFKSRRHDSISSGESFITLNQPIEWKTNPRIKSQTAFLRRLFDVRSNNFESEPEGNELYEIKAAGEIAEKNQRGMFAQRDDVFPRPIRTWRDFSPDQIVALLNDLDMERNTLRCKSIFLPPCCAYVAWTIAIASSIACTFFIVLYGLTYGYKKSVDWIRSCVFAFGQDAIVMDPLHVFMFAVIMTYCVELAERHRDNRDDDDEEN